jgi:hypothetical protein
MLGLREFTSEEVARLSRTPTASVRSTLRRYPLLWHEVGREQSGRRGGSWLRYRLTSEGVSWLRSHLYDYGEAGAPPAEFLAAEDILMTEVPAEGSPETKSRLLRRAQRLVASGAMEDPSGATAQADQSARQEALSLLIRLVQAELGDDNGEWCGALDSLLTAKQHLAVIEGGAYYRALIQRFVSSSVADPDIAMATSAVMLGSFRESFRESVLSILKQMQERVGHRPPGLSNWIGNNPAESSLESSLIRLLALMRSRGEELVFELSPRPASMEFDIIRSICHSFDRFESAGFAAALGAAKNRSHIGRRRTTVSPFDTVALRPDFKDYDADLTREAAKRLVGIDLHAALGASPSDVLVSQRMRRAIRVPAGAEAHWTWTDFSNEDDDVTRPRREAIEVIGIAGLRQIAGTLT